MSNTPTIQVTHSAIRQKISSNFDDLITFTAASGSTTQCTVPARTHQMLATAGSLVGAELTCYSGTGSGQSTQITAHTLSSDTVTLTFRTLGTALDSTSLIEIHNINGDGYTKSQYDNAIYAAIDVAADTYFTDLSKVLFAISASLPNNNPITSYPLPSGFSKIWEVDVAAYPPITRSPTAAMTTWLGFNDVTARTRVGQSFTLGNSYNLVQYIAVYMYAVASPTGNITMVVETDSSGPSGTAVTNGSTSNTVAATSIPTHPGFVVFTFDPPMLLTGSTTYWWYLKSSVAVSSTNYFNLGVDGNGQYGNGQIAIRNASVWDTTTHAAKDFIFAVSGEGNWWRRLKKTEWRYQAQSTDQLWISTASNYYEGSPIQIVGGAPIARTTADTDTIPIRPEFVETYAMVFLREQRAGVPSGINAAASAQSNMSRLPLIPPPRRALPPNTVDVY